ncbi:signal peptidase I [Mycetocola tolaasinivorans]|uniref:signal peptidase I n=1 Tax=Mycetocola tolaasinivorans TaxID=76635 RepID=UPI001FE7A933|nr:signal peptidase I [Mycetocola tolaasinivorans]
MAVHTVTPRSPTRVGARLGNLLLNLAAVAGALCIVLVILAFVFNITLIMFKTGSMAPTIPAGSVALVREVPASELRVGDVVTVDRPGQLPITHRVTSVSEGSGPDSRSITMRGDANAIEDPAPYVISQARLVIGSLPGLAYVVVWFGNPWVLGSLTLALSALVTWAFWPRGARPAPEPRRRGRHATGVATLAVAIGVAAASLAAPSPAQATAVPEGPTEKTLTARTFSLVSVTDTYRMANMTPGESVNWDLGVRSRSTGPLTVSIAASGEERLGLVAGFSACADRWQGDACVPGATSVSAPDRLRLDGVQRTVSNVASGDTRWYRMTVTLPTAPDPTVPAEAASQVVLRITDPDGTTIEVPSEPGVSPGVTPPPVPGEAGGLPHTGGTVDLGRMLLALLAIGAGVLFAGIARTLRGRAM